MNGNSGNGTRITWFSENGLLATVDRETVYAEFAKNGYITVPEGAVALNVPMSPGADAFELYLLDREHVYENGSCLGCGETMPGDPEIDLFVFSGQSNMMGAAVLEPERDVFTDMALEYKFMPRLPAVPGGGGFPYQ